MSKVKVNVEKKIPVPEEASDAQKPTSNTFEGKIVSLIGNKLVTTNKEGKESSNELAKDAKLIFGGVVCKPEDLKAGSIVRVTTKKNFRYLATGVESLDKTGELVQCI